MNKVDLIQDRTLLPFIEEPSSRFEFDAVLPVSALRSRGLMSVKYLERHVPEGPHLFPEDQITDCSQRFLAAELVREKIIRQLGDELPYAAAVEIESFAEDDRGVLHIHSLILVERDGQKKF